MASRSTPEIQREIDVVLPLCKAVQLGLPNEGDIAAPNERERVWHQRRVLTSLITALTSPMEGRVTKLDGRLAERKHWHTMLTACRLDLEKSLAAVEGSNTNFRLVDALRLSLRILRNGGEGDDEMFATPLLSWLHKNGVRPEPGSRSYMSGRGGLLSVERELAELEKERDEVIQRVEASLAEAKQLLASFAEPAATV